MRRLRAVQAAANLRLGRVLRWLIGTPRMNELGFGHAGDFCNNRLGETLRTVQRWMELYQAAERFPLIKAAFLAGEIHQVKARELGAYLRSHPEEEEERVNQACGCTVRALREELGNPIPEAESEQRVYRLTPRGYRRVQKFLERVRCVAGAELSDSEAHELGCAEYLAGAPLPPREASEDTDSPSTEPSRSIEEELEEIWRGWDFLGADRHPVELLEGELPTDAWELQAEAFRLLRSRRHCELALGQLLVAVDDLGLCCFRSIGHYAEEFLGMASSTARTLVARERGLARHPEVRQAVWDGLLTPFKAGILMPLFDRGVSAEPWMLFARRVTCDVLFAWVRHLKGLSQDAFEEWKTRTPETVDPGKACPQWVLRCHQLGMKLLDWPFRLMSTSDFAAVGVAAHPLLGGLAMLGDWIACQMLSPHSENPRRIPFVVYHVPEALAVVLQAEAAARMEAGEWLSPESALLQIADHFLQEYQDPGLRGLRRKVLERDRYRCSSPGCTARANLHLHHIHYRSRGGKSVLGNLGAYCAACHLRVIHPGYMKVSLDPDTGQVRCERRGEVFIGGFRVVPEPLLLDTG
ncbi:MAG: HNH endonuclease signature motif containing protein [Candidatus Eremiobacterota bacterium]